MNSTTEYPVPTNDLINIDIKDARDINIYNVSGQIVCSLKNQNEVISLNVSDWKKGVYFVEIIENDMNKRTGKFVVK